MLYMKAANWEQIYEVTIVAFEHILIHSIQNIFHNFVTECMLLGVTASKCMYVYVYM